MQNLECPECQEIGWGLVESDAEELTIKMYCTMCDYEVVHRYKDGDSHYRAQVSVTTRTIMMRVTMLGQEIMEKTGWDDCNVFAMIREEANRQIPEGC